MYLLKEASINPSCQNSLKCGLISCEYAVDCDDAVLTRPRRAKSRAASGRVGGRPKAAIREPRVCRSDGGVHAGDVGSVWLVGNMG